MSASGKLVFHNDYVNSYILYENLQKYKCIHQMQLYTCIIFQIPHQKYTW